MPARAPSHLARIASVSLLSGGVLITTGCAGGDPQPGSSIKTPLDRKLPTGPSTPASSPMVAGGENGLELHWFLSAADPATLGAALAPYAERTIPVDARHRALLAYNGLRLIAVPLDRLTEVQARLASVGAEQRQWLGQAPNWIEVIPGPERPEGQTISMHDGPLRLGPGRLRLLVRCWTIPLAPASPAAPAAALHMEIIPQHKESTPAEHSGAGLSLIPSAGETEDQGLLFTRLLTRLTVPQGEAYLIVPETPGTVWKGAETNSANPPPTPPAPSPTPPPPQHQAPAVGQVIRGSDSPSPPTPAPKPPAPSSSPRTSISFPDPAGPPSQANPTLGESMLKKVADETSQRTVRAIVVLIPRVPAKYELLPR